MDVHAKNKKELEEKIAESQKSLFELRKRN